MGGGGIYAAQGNVTVNAAQVDGNNASGIGGGIAALAGNVTLSNAAQVDQNSAAANGGGIFDIALDSTQGINITGATVAGNLADLNGGGIYLGTGTISLLNSTVSGNQALSTVGGGIDNTDSSGQTIITNSTIGGNSAQSAGGGIIAANGAVINNSTIALNTLAAGGTGAGLDAGAAIQINNTIVAGNYAGTVSNEQDIAGAAAGSNNVVAGAASAGGLVNGTHANIVGLNGSGTRAANTIINTNLANNGGPTETYSLVFGSVAADGGNSALNPSSVGKYDERGPGYPRSFNGSMDIGAVQDDPLGVVMTQGPVVKIFGQDGVLLGTLTPFSGTSVSAATVAVGNVVGDGVPSIVVASANNLGEIKIYDGKTGQLVHTDFPYGSSYTGGLNIALGDVEAGNEEIIVGPGGSGKPVEILNASTGAVVLSFTPFPTEIPGAKYTGGVQVAAGDLNGNASGQDEVIVGTSNPQPAYAEVWTYNGSTMVRTGQHWTFDGKGVYLAAGALVPGGHADIVVGSSEQSGSTATSKLYVIDGLTGNVVASLPAGALGVFSNSKLNTGVRVAVRDVNGDGIADIEAATGSGSTQQVRVFDFNGSSLTLEETINAAELGLPGNYTSGIYVG